MPSAVRRPRHRAALALAAAALALPLAVGCGALDKAIDCANTASTIASSVNKLQQAITSVADNPLQSQQALNDIDRELKALGDKTDNADHSKAVKDLTAGVTSVRKAIDSGDKTPDLTPITNAASEIGKVCTPG